MGKRSDFKRRKSDLYDTIDPRAVKALLPHLKGVETFIEPCDGNGYLRHELEAYGLKCKGYGDIAHGEDALALKTVRGADVIISNPPWTRQLLHPLIDHLQMLAPTWLLFDSDWMFNRHAVSHLGSCTDIVAVGRLHWIAGTTMTGKDNCAWYRFDWRHKGGPHFHPRHRLPQHSALAHKGGMKDLKGRGDTSGTGPGVRTADSPVTFRRTG